MQATPGTTDRSWWRRAGRGGTYLAALALVLPVLIVMIGCGDTDAPGPDRGTAEASDDDEPGRAMSGYETEWWERKVPITILLTGGHLGHLQPCGCTDPKTGGLERVASILQRLRRVRAKASGGTVGALALGWSMRGNHEAQEAVKADYLRGAYEELGFNGIMLGGTDVVVDAMCQPRGTEGVLMPRPPVNIMLSARNAAIMSSPLFDTQVGKLPLRVITVLDPTVADELEAEGFVQRKMSATQALAGLPPQPDRVWIVGARPRDEPTLDLIRKGLKRQGPAIIVDVAGQDRGVDRVDRKKLVAGEDPLVVELSEFGSAVGVLDFEPTDDGKGWLVSYRRLDLVPQWSKYAGPDTKRVNALELLYREMVKEEGYLLDFPRASKADARYVGSSACARCHPAIYNDWKKTAHAGALRTLKTAGYDWDPDCVRCHVVGWERTGRDAWSARKGGFRSPQHTGYLGGVGCESCHGPGSAHIADPWSKAPFADGGPNRATPGLRDTCIHCHDREQSHGFIRGFRREHLPAVNHSGVPADRRTVMPLTEGGKRKGR